MEQPATPPPPPATLEQSAPSPPTVTYQNGQLTIDAHNATLAQVLRAVQSKTGASIDMPSGVSNERVVTRLGPGQPREILNALLNGSKFDYIILGVTGNPGGVQKVILTTRQSTGQAVNTAQNNNPGQSPQQQFQPGEEEPTPVEEEVPQPEASNFNEGQQDPQQMVPGRFRPVPPQGDGQENANAVDGQQPGVKTPEQLLQELQKMQQQQQMYQQQLNPANQEPQQQQ